jgi:peptidoglycan/xylan/chitin deacetylase (PgdA/CDA1 family)
MLTLMYHNILDVSVDDVPAAGQQVTVSMFRQNIKRMKGRLLDPVKVHRELLDGHTPRGVLVTFDDGAAGILDAARVLADAGATGVAFICPGAIKSGLWFYRLADLLLKTKRSAVRWREFDLALHGPQNRRDAYRRLSTTLFDLPAATRDQCLIEIADIAEVRAGEPHRALATLDEEGLRRAASTGGVVFANHSWSHPNLTMLSDDELIHEIEAAQSWLEASGLPTLPWFAFPRGVHDARVREAVSSSCTAQFGANAAESARGVISRTGIYRVDINPFRFALKTALGGNAHATWKSILW